LEVNVHVTGFCAETDNVPNKNKPSITAFIIFSFNDAKIARNVLFFCQNSTTNIAKEMQSVSREIDEPYELEYEYQL
jgi:hypothetical protein